MTPLWPTSRHRSVGSPTITKSTFSLHEPMYFFNPRFATSSSISNRKTTSLLGIVAIYEMGVEEIMVVAHSHCGACHMSYDHFHHEMIARGVTDETLDTIRKCGINLDHWLEGFKDTPESVRKTVETIKTHPLVPKDIIVRGFIIDSETGEMEEIKSYYVCRR